MLVPQAGNLPVTIPEVPLVLVSTRDLLIFTPPAKRSLFGNKRQTEFVRNLSATFRNFTKDQCPPIESSTKTNPPGRWRRPFPVSKSRRHIQSPRGGQLVGPFPLSPRCERCLVFSLCGTGARSRSSCFCRSDCRPSGKGGNNDTGK